MNIVKTILEYFLHASTYKGIFNLLASAGIYTVAPTLEGQITAAAIGIVGLIQVFIDDHDKTKEVK